MSAALDVRELSISYRFRDRWLPVVEDVSFSIAPGEAFGLVGESGCGKSTIALALVRYLAENGRVDAGSIELGGEELYALDGETLRRWRGGRIAMVYQEAGSALNPSLRVGEQIAEVCRTHGGLDHAAARARALELVSQVALADPELILRRYPHQLSGGQQQRIVIAMALAGGPELLILDEPTTGLDATVEAEVIDLIARLRRELDVAILFISHNLGLVSRVCDRVGILYSGRIVEQGAAIDVLTSPHHPYTHGLVRCVPPFGASKRTFRLEPIPGSLPELGALTHGCRFAARCPLVRDDCRADEPPLVPVDGDRSVRCYHWPEVAGLPARAEPVVVARAATANGDRALLELRSLRRSFGRVTPVDDLSLSIGRAEIFGLVGESGSGKTTLVNCIAGLVPSDSGELLYDGASLERRVGARSHDVRGRLQMVFQNPDSTLNPRHTVGYVLRRAVSRLKGRRTAAELAKEVRIPERSLQSRSSQLSGGQKQRVAIARAFAGTPELVLCDEPVSALDVSVQAAVLNLLADLQEQEGVSYVFISHDLGVVRYLADRIGVMYLGQLVEIGAAEDVFEPAQHPYTEALVSAIPTLELTGARRERIRLAGPPPSLASPPSGCRFHTRCPRKIGAICETEAPPWREDRAGHQIRCHYAVDELRRLQTPDRPDGGLHGQP